ncbi:MAG: hypothetical protein J5867_08495 [Prevotella sp.]|nr:hypothetical protein [Prevotella sp.]
MKTSVFDGKDMRLTLFVWHLSVWMPHLSLIYVALIDHECRPNIVKLGHLWEAEKLIFFHVVGNQ